MTEKPRKPKVGVYGDDAVVTETTTDTTTADAEPSREKSGGIPSWAVALIVLAVVILAIILFF